MRAFLAAWPKIDDHSDLSDACSAINNSLNELLHGVGISEKDAMELVGVGCAELHRIYAKWCLARGWEEIKEPAATAQYDLQYNPNSGCLSLLCQDEMFDSLCDIVVDTLGIDDVRGRDSNTIQSIVIERPLISQLKAHVRSRGEFVGCVLLSLGGGFVLIVGLITIIGWIRQLF